MLNLAAAFLAVALYYVVLRRISARLVSEAARTEHLLTMLPEPLAKLPDLAPFYEIASADDN